MPAEECPNCTEPMPAINAVNVALVVLVAILVIWALLRVKARREGFVSQRAAEVFNSAKPLLDQTKGNLPYSDYRHAVAGADPVQHDDVRRLYKAGKLTPEAVQGVL